MDEITNLPEPKIPGKISFEECLYKRRSVRRFTDDKISLEDLSQILWSAQGITDQNMEFRTAPSAGAIYPIVVYVITKDGFFLYIPDGHKIKKIVDGDLREKLAVSCVRQRFIAKAPVNVLICAIYQNITKRYGERGIRYANFEAGHIAQNIHLQAVALDLGSVAVGAFDDFSIKTLLNLDENVQPLYIIPVGFEKK